MRLDKLIVTTQQTSRKATKRLLPQKQVKVDGVIELDGRRNVDPSLQKITIRNQQIKATPHVYYLLNKPAGVVTAKKDQEHQTVIDLLKAADYAPDIYPVGRLDRDTEGLLLLTNNGQLGYELLLPHKKVVKGYQVVVNAQLTPTDVAMFAEGITFDGGVRCQPATLEILKATTEASEAYVEIQEGKFHQVKKMFLACGKKVMALKRVKMGPLLLDGDLALGEYRPLTRAELNQLAPYFERRV